MITPANERLRIGGFPVRKTSSGKLAADLLTRIERKERVVLFFANTNFVVKCRSLLHKMDDESIVIVNDGIGMDIAVRLLYKNGFEENLNGTDFTPYLFGRATAPLRVFLLGGKPEVLDKAADHVRLRLGQEVVGFCDGYGGIAAAGLVETINRCAPDIVLVALGNPIQENWILENRKALDAPVCIGVGALLDFWAGEKPRAPAAIRKFRLEWLYRLYLEPRRLTSRYTVDVLRFLFLCYRCREHT